MGKYLDIARAKDGEPQWTLFLAEREQKPQTSAGLADGIPDPGEPMRRRSRTGGR